MESILGLLGGLGGGGGGGGTSQDVDVRQNNRQVVNFGTITGKNARNVPATGLLGGSAGLLIVGAIVVAIVLARR